MHQIPLITCDFVVAKNKGTEKRQALSCRHSDSSKSQKRLHIDTNSGTHGRAPGCRW